MSIAIDVPGYGTTAAGWEEPFDGEDGVEMLYSLTDLALKNMFIERDLSSTRSISAEGLRIGGSITAGANIRLDTTHVLGDVVAKDPLVVKDSTIEGMASCEATDLLVEGSTIGTLYIKRPVVCSQVDYYNYGRAVSLRIEDQLTASGDRIQHVSIEVFSGQRRLAVPVWSVAPAVAQTVRLRNSSVGTIAFEGELGRVILEGASSVTQAIHGGRIY